MGWHIPSRPGIWPMYFLSPETCHLINCPQVITKKPRGLSVQQSPRVLTDIEQTVTQHRQSPALARSKQPCPRDFSISLRSEFKPEQMAQFTQTEKTTVGPK